MTIEQAAPETEQPTRSTADVLAGRLRIRLAGQWFVLPVLTIRQNEEWLEQLDGRLAPLLAGTDSLAAAIAQIERFGDRMLDLVRAYDVTGVLPEPGDWERDIYPHELLRAVMEVRLATDPTLSYAVAAALEETPPLVPAIPSGSGTGSPRSTGGRSRKRGKR